MNRTSGSVHTGLSIAELAAGGVLHPHVHSHEEGFYILSGEVVVVIAGVPCHLGPGDYGAVKVGTAHAMRAVGGKPIRWLQMAAPQPKPPGAERDTFFCQDRTVPLGAPSLDVTNLQGRLLGHFDETMNPPVGDRPVAGPGLEGVFLKWLIDEVCGARHHRMLFIEYRPGVRLGCPDMPRLVAALRARDQRLGLGVSVEHVA